MIAPGLSQYERGVIARFVDEVDGGQKIFPEGQLAELAEVLFRLQLDDQKSKAVDITGCKASPRLRRAVQAAGPAFLFLSSGSRALTGTPQRRAFAFFHSPLLSPRPGGNPGVWKGILFTEVISWRQSSPLPLPSAPSDG